LIPGLQETAFAAFVGKNTNANLAAMEPKWLLHAKNVMILGDGQPRKIPGYTLVKSGLKPVIKQFDWQRDFDRRQFLIVQNGTVITAMGTDGSNPADIATGESSDKYDFVTNFFALLGSNGHNAWAWMDSGGTLTKYKWGISQPLTAPSVATSGGTLTLNFGRSYVYCGVRYVTDSQGNQRMHIGPPSDFSAHSGPITASVNTLSNLAAVAGEGWTHFWIFATVDSPFSASATFRFAAEIPVATTSWGDTLSDDDLDITRLAPFDNYPAPAASILVSYQNRIVAIDPNTGFIYLSGYEEIDLGIPEMAFPPSLFFQIPSGVRQPTGARVVNDGDTLLIGTQEAWYKITGFDAQTFQKKDRVLSPGPVSKTACCKMATGHLAWLGFDKRIRIWNGIQPYLTLPVESIDVSASIGPKLQGTYGMEDLSDAQLGTAELRSYSFGGLHFLMVFANTADVGAGLNLVQMWFVNVDGAQISSLGETDFIPVDVMTSSAEVLVNGKPYIFMGDAQGNIYRWPDGYLHNEQGAQHSVSTPWTGGPQSRFYFADVQTDRNDALSSFSMQAVCAPQPDMTVSPKTLEIQDVPDPAGVDPSFIRGNLQEQGTSVGKWIRLIVNLPSDDSPAEIQKIQIWRKPIYAVVP
jgi:hypothetical protein